MAAQVADLASQPGFAETFLPAGRAPAVGELFRMPGAARALLTGEDRRELITRLPEKRKAA